MRQKRHRHPAHSVVGPQRRHRQCSVRSLPSCSWLAQHAQQLHAGQHTACIWPCWLHRRVCTSRKLLSCQSATPRRSKWRQKSRHQKPVRRTLPTRNHCSVPTTYVCPCDEMLSASSLSLRRREHPATARPRTRSHQTTRCVALRQTQGRPSPLSSRSSSAPQPSGGQPRPLEAPACCGGRTAHLTQQLEGSRKSW